MRYENPVIAGCYPDPSVCRVGDTFYLVCSSFHFFPGVPLFESRDLLNWTQIGHVLTRPSQLPLAETNSVGGIYAPTIRYHNGWFYMVTTNVSHGGNFYVRTNDIHGAWSDPIYVEQGGIDPSFFFEDGKAYFMSNGGEPDGRASIFLCEIDIETGRTLTEPVPIWRGTGGRFLESPHIYRIHGEYYLFASEGGTEYGHMVVCARSKTLFGPYVGDAHNPILTNRNRGGYPLQGCGHADLVDDGRGHWWLLHLGFRTNAQWLMHHNTGREVNLTPMFLAADGRFTAGDAGTVSLSFETDAIAENVTQQKPTAFSFANTAAGREWVFLQNPHTENYRLTHERFSLYGTDADFAAEQDSPTWVGIRQKEMRFRLDTDMTVTAQEAGVMVYMTGTQHYEILTAVRDGGLCLIRRAHLGTLICEDCTPLPADAERIHLTVSGDAAYYRFAAECCGQSYDLGILETKYLSSEVACNFTGVMFGLFAHAASPEQAEWSTFTDFSLEFSV